MKLLFIYSDLAITNQRRFQFGIAYLSSVLKQDDVETELIHIYSSPKKEVFLKKIKNLDPDIIAYSSLTNQYPTIKMLANWSKELKIFTIYGDMHPTVAPEVCINTPGIDAICIGEGEAAIRKFVDAFSNRKDITSIQNFWVRDKLRIYKSPVGPLIEDLDSIPFPDYDIFPYEETDDYKVSRSITVQASRGCLYSCAYCCNHYLRALYPNKNKYFRFRSVDSVVYELKFLLSKYPRAKIVRFTDDALSADRTWFEEFATRYRAEIDLPYSANDHPNNITNYVAQLYKQSGCNFLSMGIENGNSYIRQDVMKRPFSNETIINAFSLMRQMHISTAAFNIVGIPYESITTILETVKLNARARPNRYTNAYFQPFGQTQAAKICYEAGWRIKELPGSFFEEPAVELPAITREQLIFGFKYFGLLVRLYKILYRFSGNKASNGIRIFDRLFCSNLMPYRFLNTVMINRMDIKKRFPTVGLCLTMLKRLIFKQRF